MTTKKERTLLSIFGGLAMFPIVLLVTGQVFMDMWEWFVVPLGVRPIGFWHALGLSSVAGWTTTGLTVYTVCRDDKIGIKGPSSFYRQFILIVVLLTSWGVTAFYHFMM